MDIVRNIIIDNVIISNLTKAAYDKKKMLNMFRFLFKKFSRKKFYIGRELPHHSIIHTFISFMRKFYPSTLKVKMRYLPGIAS